MKEYIDREATLNERPEGRNPGQVGKEEYNKGWNDCRSAFYKCITSMPIAGNPREAARLMGYEVADMIEDCIENTPTIDAVPVVRCRECSHSQEYLDDELFCLCFEDVVPLYGYCYKGERKETDHEQ